MKLMYLKEDFLFNNAWSANKFIDHAKFILNELELNGFKLFYQRTFIKIEKNNKSLKIYCHFNNKNREFISLIENKKEIKFFHYTVSKEEILSYFNNYFQ